MLFRSQNQEVLYWIGGTATNGVDYTPQLGNGIPLALNTLIIPANQPSVTYNIQAIADNIPEGQEYITIYLANPLCTESSAADSINFFINDFLDVSIEASEENTCIGNCIDLTANIPDLPATTFEWSANSPNGNTLQVEVCPTQATTYSIDAEIGRAHV